ncbi:hypothetical protein HPB48_012849 [Haemaphysalis longicornis]|uniref:Platelet-derived growth factor (PDGF) family profile domain-containing protein n=1 Tax=Haemaphysalis longicornis TaxID=44386 RepID=A0A9J6FSF8_HAELO|nr:hypothetical protein HPB48_012849 [Haemaphysalis longicornis]
MDGAARPVLLLRCGTVASRPRSTVIAPSSSPVSTWRNGAAEGGAARFPSRRTVCVQDIYPNGSKRYTPHCTIVHRCAPDAGCCTPPEEHCQPKTIEKIVRRFLVRELIDGGEQRTTVEKLAFDNHTECECRAKYDHTR